MLDEPRCKHCDRTKAQHWTDGERFFCASADLPNPKLFANIASAVEFEAADGN